MTWPAGNYVFTFTPQALDIMASREQRCSYRRWWTRVRRKTKNIVLFCRVAWGE
jgi:hypothetical protein